MVVVSELNMRLLADFTGSIERLSYMLPSIRLVSHFFVNPGNDDVSMADDLTRLDDLGPLLAKVIV